MFLFCFFQFFCETLYDSHNFATFVLTIFLGYLLVVLFSSDPPSSHTEPKHLAKYNNISECCMRDLGTSHCVRSPYVGPPVQSYTLTTAYKQIIMTSPSYILLSCFVP